MVRRHERYTAYRTFVVSPGSSANGRKRLPPTIGSRDVLILLLSLQAHELARNPPASLHVERPSRHGSNPLEPAMLRFRRVPPPVAAALGLAEAPAELVRDPIARRIHFDRIISIIRGEQKRPSGGMHGVVSAGRERPAR